MNTYIISAEVACAPVEDGAVLLHMGTKRYYSLNETAAAIWHLLANEVPVSELSTRLVEEYEVDPRAADEAIADLLAELAAEALISVKSS